MYRKGNDTYCAWGRAAKSCGIDCLGADVTDFYKDIAGTTGIDWIIVANDDGEFDKANRMLFEKLLASGKVEFDTIPEVLANGYKEKETTSV